MTLFKLTTCLFLSLSTVSQIAYAQDFIKDYKQYRLIYHQYQNSKQLDRSINQMKRAFKKYEHKTHISMLIADTVFMVYEYYVEYAESTEVIWNPHGQCFLCKYAFLESLIVKPNASAYLNNYQPEFRRWVESSDTSNYAQYGRKAKWFDAPGVSFTVAVKSEGHWHFISSGSYTNNVEQLSPKH